MKKVIIAQLRTDLDPKAREQLEAAYPDAELVGVEINPRYGGRSDRDGERGRRRGGFP